MKKEADKNIWKEVARDFIALGGIPFLILVLARIWILSQPVYFSQFFASGIIFILIALLFRSNLYSGLALIMLFFTSVHYNDIKFTVLGSFVYLGLLISLFYLKYDKKSIIKGIFLGILCTGIGYFLIKWIFG